MQTCPLDSQLFITTYAPFSPFSSRFAVSGARFAMSHIFISLDRTHTVIATVSTQNGYKGSRNGRFLPPSRTERGPVDWQLLAACRGVDSSLFFHPEGERGAARSARENSAKEVCMRCPVRAECAAHALAVREPYGVWGGLTEDEREELMGRARNRLVSASTTSGDTAQHH